MQMKVTLQGKSTFQAVAHSGNQFTFDAHPEFGGEGNGPTPLEGFLGSLAACSAMDVIAILRKKKQDVTAYTVEVITERVPEGTWPRPYTRLELRHTVSGNNIDPIAVARAVELSDEKYCSVSATLREQPTLVSTFTILAAGEPTVELN